MSGDSPSRVVAIRPGALGDTLLTFPALALLRRRWPSARLLLVGRADLLPLAEATGLVDEVSSYALNAWSALFTLPPPRDGLAGEVLATAVAAVAWLPDDEGSLARTLAVLGARQVCVSPGRPPGESRQHAAAFLAQGLAPLGIDAPRDQAALRRLVPRLEAPEADQAMAAQCWDAVGLPRDGARVLALHPGSGSAAKCWPSECFARLATLLMEGGYVPLLIAGPQDGEVVEAIRARLWPVVPLIASDLSVGALAATLIRCVGFVGNDSGVAHLAGLLRVPTVTLFGPTNPEIWAPLAARGVVVRAPEGKLSLLTPATVWNALRTLLRGK